MIENVRARRAPAPSGGRSSAVDNDHLGSFRFAGFQFVFLRSRSLLVSTSRMIDVGVTLIATVVGANRCVACRAKAAKTDVPTNVATDIPIRARKNLAMR